MARISTEYTISRIRNIDKAIDELATGAQSSTITTNGFTQSYTRPEMGALIALRDKLTNSITSQSRARRTQPDFSE